jgi:hypothetical protein
MIRSQSQCPYCNQCVVAYDWDADKIIFNPDLVKPIPCEHVAYVGVYCVTLGQMLSHRHTIWRHSAADPSLDDYLRGISNGTAAPAATFKVTDGVHEHQHSGGTDSVTVCGIYAPDPEVFLRVCLESMRKDWHT